MGAGLIALAPELLQAQAGIPGPCEIVPAPAELTFQAGRLPMKGVLAVAVVGNPDNRLRAALARLGKLWSNRMGIGFEDPDPAVPGPIFLRIECAGPGPAVPTLGEDESYELAVSPGGAVLRAATTVGALRGLATLVQLPQRDSAGWHLPAITLRDSPRFPWRGLMIDVARHWQPPGVIERNLDAMALVKLNVLHLHLTDDQGFRIESRSHPELCAQGSDGRYFTQEQMRDIVAYAASRGIRVVPEFDLPGHATSWVVSHPELASLPGPYSIERHWGVFNPVLDPTKEEVYRLLDDFLGEMSGIFPDPWVHIGGDENNGVQWSANPRIQAFLRARGLDGNAGLQAYFNGRVGAILARHGKRMVGWDEILAPGLAGGTVIQSWRGAGSLAAAARLGYDGVLSNGYYIDLMQPAGSHYLNDPIQEGTSLTEVERRRILGGEATMWSEWVTPDTIDSRIWPRTAAIAERLWSPREVRDVADMYRRLDAISARLEEGGSMQAKGPEALARRLAGGDPDPSDREALRIFLEAIEPVKGYERGTLQPWSVQSTPLDGIADCAQPESRSARVFAGDVDRALAAGGRLEPAVAAPMISQLAAWGRAGSRVAENLSGRSAALKEAAPLARALAKVSATGLDAVGELVAGGARSRAWFAAQSAILDSAAPPVSAAELPMIPPIRRLVAAAAGMGSGGESPP